MLMYMVTVPHIYIIVGLERMLDYRGVGLERFHCTCIHTCVSDTIKFHCSPTYITKYTNVSSSGIVWTAVPTST